MEKNFPIFPMKVTSKDTKSPFIKLREYFVLQNKKFEFYSAIQNTFCIFALC